MANFLAVLLTFSASAGPIVGWEPLFTGGGGGGGVWYWFCANWGGAGGGLYGLLFILFTVEGSLYS